MDGAGDNDKWFPGSMGEGGKTCRKRLWRGDWRPGNKRPALRDPPWDAADGRQQDGPGQGGQDLANPGVILVAHGAQNEDREAAPGRTRPAASSPARRRRGFARRRDLRSVKQNNLPAGALHPLQAPGPLHLLESRPDGGIGDRELFHKVRATARAREALVR